jgi:hypothetical protein
VKTAGESRYIIPILILWKEEVLMSPALLDLLMAGVDGELTTPAMVF